MLALDLPATGRCRLMIRTFERDQNVRATDERE
jgi:hypothetical protein